jgi:hypothetical protein
MSPEGKAALAQLVTSFQQEKAVLTEQIALLQIQNRAQQEQIALNNTDAQHLITRIQTSEEQLGVLAERITALTKENAHLFQQLETTHAQHTQATKQLIIQNAELKQRVLLEQAQKEQCERPLQLLKQIKAIKEELQKIERIAHEHRIIALKGSALAAVATDVTLLLVVTAAPWIALATGGALAWIQLHATNGIAASKSKPLKALLKQLEEELQQLTSA